MSDGAAEMYGLAVDLSAVGRKMVVPMRGVFSELGVEFADEWAANARLTSGVHGKHYPESVDSELKFAVSGIEVEVGPNSAKPQGSMGRGFEFGSVNQPPHLDGLKASEKIEPIAEKRIAATVTDLIP